MSDRVVYEIIPKLLLWTSTNKNACLSNFKNNLFSSNLGCRHLSPTPGTDLHQAVLASTRCTWCVGTQLLPIDVLPKTQGPVHHERLKLIWGDFLGEWNLVELVARQAVEIETPKLFLENVVKTNKQGVHWRQTWLLVGAHVSWKKDLRQSSCTQNERV